MQTEDGKRPRLLLQGINYKPDLIGISKYNSETAEWFVQHGWDVLAVTAPPYYPSWARQPGYSFLRYQRERLDGVNVVRCPMYVPLAPSGSRRLAHLGSYAATSFPCVLAAAVSFRPDVVFSVAPALFAALGCACAARISGALSWLHVQDFELDVAFKLGILKNSALRSSAERFERFTLRRYDALSAPSVPMVSLLSKKVSEDTFVAELRNWADVDTINPRIDASELRQVLNLENKLVVLYSGNMATKQGLEIILEAATQLQSRQDLAFVLCGDGPAKATLVEHSRNLPNVVHLPLQPVERLPMLLAAADIHVLPQKAEAEDLVLPSKLSGILASGRPVVATARQGSGIAAEIAGAGELVPSGDRAAFAAMISKLADDPPLRNAYGAAARKLAETRWRRDAILAELERMFRLLVAKKRTVSFGGSAPEIPQAPHRAGAKVAVENRNSYAPSAS